MFSWVPSLPTWASLFSSDPNLINGHVRQFKCRRATYSAQSAPFLKLASLKTEMTPIDLSKTGVMYPIYDQGDLGSCTSNGVLGAYDYDLLNHLPDASDKIQQTPFNPSRLYLYYKERELENQVSTDSGATVADAITILRTHGVCSEASWPYVTSQFAVQPPASCDVEAKEHHSTCDRQVSQTLNDLYSCLASGFLIPFGFVVYPSFRQIDASGMVSMPQSGEVSIGGHCLALVGYDPAKKLFKAVNSWGVGFGDQGYVYFPEDYILNPALASDFHVVTNFVNEDSLLNHINSSLYSGYRQAMLTQPVRPRRSNRLASRKED
jgi:C1A family cysteine protease